MYFGNVTIIILYFYNDRYNHVILCWEYRHYLFYIFVAMFPLSFYNLIVIMINHIILFWEYSHYRFFFFFFWVGMWPLSLYNFIVIIIYYIILSWKYCHYHFLFFLRVNSPGLTLKLLFVSFFSRFGVNNVEPFIIYMLNWFGLTWIKHDPHNKVYMVNTYADQTGSS